MPQRMMCTLPPLTSIANWFERAVEIDRIREIFQSLFLNVDDHRLLLLCAKSNRSEVSWLEERATDLKVKLTFVTALESKLSSLWFVQNPAEP